jgi:hypothetical protein
VGAGRGGTALPQNPARCLGAAPPARKALPPGRARAQDTFQTTCPRRKTPCQSSCFARGSPGNGGRGAGGRDDQQAEHAIGSRRKTEVRMLKEVLHEGDRPAEGYRSRRRSQQGNRYQYQPLREHSLQGMEAEPGHQIKVGFGVMNLVHAPQRGNGMKQAVRAIGGKIKGRKADGKLCAVRQSHSVQRPLRRSPKGEGERNATQRVDEEYSDPRNREQDRVADPSSRGGTAQGSVQARFQTKRHITNDLSAL